MSRAPGRDPTLAAAYADVPDATLVARVLAGERDVYAVLIARHADACYRHAWQMTGSPDVAEDLLQMGFIKAYQSLSTVHGRFDAWVFRIVANLSLDWLKNIRRKDASYEGDVAESPRPTPHQELERQDLGERLDDAMARLAPSLREAFVLKHVEGLSYEEISARLGTSVGALKMRVHRARESLQTYLQPYVDAER